jgi:acyl carrier protein
VKVPLDPEQGLQIVRALVAECLARDLAEVQPQSRLITDLGADSLDFVDLIFTFEKRFGVRIRETDLNLTSRPDVSGPNAGAGGEFLPAETVARLQAWLPELAAAPDLSQVRPAQVLPLVTVAALWRLVQHKASGAQNPSSART